MMQIELPEDTTFLVIDESESFRTGMTSGLRALGFRHFYQASSGKRALEMLKQVKIDFVICEVDIRPMSGAEFLKEFREQIDRSGTPFLMMGVDVNKGDIAILAEYEIDGFITKPFTFIELARKISQCAQYYNMPNHSERTIAEARELLHTGEHTRALELFQTVLDKMPNSARIRVGMAKAYRAMGDVEHAKQLCQEAADKNPFYVQAYDELSSLYFERNENKEGLEMFHKAVDLSPYNPQRYLQAYELLLVNEDYAAAEDVLFHAKENNVSLYKMSEKWGTVLFFQKKIEKAVYYFEKSIRKDESNRPILNMMAISLKTLGRFEDSLKYYNLALKYDPDDIKLLFNKGLCYIQMRELQKAKKIYERILDLEADHEKAQEKLAELEKLLEPKSKSVA